MDGDPHAPHPHWLFAGDLADANIREGLALVDEWTAFYTTSRPTEVGTRPAIAVDTRSLTTAAGWLFAQLPAPTGDLSTIAFAPTEAPVVGVDIVSDGRVAISLGGRIVLENACPVATLNPGFHLAFDATVLPVTPSSDDLAALPENTGLTPDDVLGFELEFAEGVDALTWLDLLGCVITGVAETPASSGGAIASGRYGGPSIERTLVDLYNHTAPYALRRLVGLRVRVDDDGSPGVGIVVRRDLGLTGFGTVRLAGLAATPDEHGVVNDVRVEIDVAASRGSLEIPGDRRLTLAPPTFHWAISGEACDRVNAVLSIPVRNPGSGTTVLCEPRVEFFGHHGPDTLPVAATFNTPTLSPGASGTLSIVIPEPALMTPRPGGAPIHDVTSMRVTIPSPRRTFVVRIPRPFVNLTTDARDTASAQCAFDSHFGGGVPGGVRGRSRAPRLDELPGGGLASSDASHAFAAATSRAAEPVARPVAPRSLAAPLPARR